jgi:FHS family L-fucose permease-like MFS transporter
VSKVTEAGRRYGVAFALVVTLFFAWGVANSLNDILIPQFKKAFTLTDWQTSLVQAAFYGGYLVFAMPAALFMRRYGYKAAVVLGLMFYAAGAFLFLPAAEHHQYVLFLGALFVVASGLSFLETSANPLVAVLGTPETSERRLNFAQAFNPLGVLFGVFIGGQFILSNEKQASTQLAHAVVGPYLCIAIAVLLWALLLAWVKFPPIATSRTVVDKGTSAGFLPLFRYPGFLFGVAAQFFYVGAQVGVWSFTIRYTQHVIANIPLTNSVVLWHGFVPLPSAVSAWFVLLSSLILFMIGRFVGTALMGRINPDRLMAVYAGCAAILTFIAATVGGWTGVIALAATSFFMSIMFPTIFAGAIRDLGPLTKSGSSFLVMAISGGIVAPQVMGFVSGLSSMQVAMVVPSFCFAVILVYALKAAKHPRAA